MFLLLTSSGDPVMIHTLFKFVLKILNALHLKSF